MIKLSDHDIEIILLSAEHTWENTKGLPSKLRKKYFLEQFRTLLEAKTAGLKENVCPHCLGSGYRG